MIVPEHARPHLQFPNPTNPFHPFQPNLSPSLPADVFSPHRPPHIPRDADEASGGRGGWGGGRLAPGPAFGSRGGGAGTLGDQGLLQGRTNTVSALPPDRSQ